MIEAMHLAHTRVERAAHDQPHDELNAFRSGLAQELQRRDTRQGLRIGNQQVEEAAVEGLVDQPRPSGPCNWCDMPPVPHTMTRSGSGYEAIARPIALPNM